MAIRAQNLSKKNSGQAQFTFSCPLWWNSNSNEQQVPHSLSKNINFRVEPTPQLYHEAKHLGLKLPDQESCSTQSIGEFHYDVGAGWGSNSQDQCISSESDETCWKGTEDRMKPVFVFSSPEIALNHSLVENSHPVALAPYPYTDHSFGGLLASYGPQTIIPGMTATRVPLPLDLADDGPIYVNAKQYHGILRRRQSRAKHEAQNKLVKSRKPYLHESRHRHALNRVRGSGGRFLSTKKLQQLHSTSTGSMKSILDSIHLHYKNNTSEVRKLPLKNRPIQ